MVMAATPTKHSRRFEVVKNRGTCPCGEIREYFGEGKESSFRTIKAGDPDYVDAPGGSPPFHHSIINQAGNITKTGEGVTKTDQVPQKPAGIMDIKDYYEFNKDRILADITAFGRPATEKRWQIGSGQMTALIKRWKGDGAIKKHKPHKKHIETGPVNKEARLTFDVHKAAILSDLKDSGLERTLQKWGISPQTWDFLKEHWRLDISRYNDFKNNIPTPTIPLQDEKPSYLRHIIKYWEEHSGAGAESTIISLTVDALKSLI